MAESPTFYSAFGPCMDRLQEMHRNGMFSATNIYIRQYYILININLITFGLEVMSPAVSSILVNYLRTQMLIQV